MRTCFCGLVGCVIVLSTAWIPQAMAVEQAGPGGAAQFSGEAGQAPQAKVSDLAAAVAESSAYREEVMKAAARHRDKPYLFKQGEYLVIGNDRVAAVFRTANNELAGLVDIYNGGKNRG